VYECNGLVSTIIHIRDDVFIGDDKGTCSHEPVSGLLDIQGARGLLQGLTRQGTWGAVDDTLVEGGRENNCSAVLHKCGKAAGIAGPRPIRYVSSA
jgi:hypothetical protein